MVGDEHLAKDVMQETLLQVFQSLHTVPESLSAWIRAVTRNRSLDAVKMRYRRDRHLSDGHDLSGMADREPGPEATAAFVEDVRNLEACLAGLNERTRTAIVLRFHGGASYDEIAEALGERPDTVRMRIMRALPKLKECLESKGTHHGG